MFPLSVVDFSDHHAISFDFCCNVSSVPKCNPGYLYDFCNADYESISSFLLESDFSVVFGSSNVEYIWFLIKSLICKAMSLYVPRILVKRRQNVLPSTLHLDDVFAVSDSEKASLFNTYFHSVFTRSSFQLPLFSEFEMPSSSLSDICISELDVFRVLRFLDVTKAKGCDGISPKLLKTCALSLYQPLRHLFSLSLSQKYLPLEWRTHLIKPIIKSGDNSSIINYRPISLLSVVSKVLEKLVYNSIVDFVSDSMSVSQFGFLRGRSTLQQMLVLF